MSTAQAAFVKWCSGDFAGLPGWDGLLIAFLATAIAGVQNNYNIWDAYATRLFGEGKLSKPGLKGYFRTQFVVGGILESLSFAGYGSVGTFLGLVTLAGVLHLSSAQRSTTPSPGAQEALALPFGPARLT